MCNAYKLVVSTTGEKNTKMNTAYNNASIFVLPSTNFLTFIKPICHKISK